MRPTEKRRRSERRCGAPELDHEVVVLDGVEHAKQRIEETALRVRHQRQQHERRNPEREKKLMNKKKKDSFFPFFIFFLLSLQATTLCATLHQPRRTVKTLTLFQKKRAEKNSRLFLRSWIEQAGLAYAAA
jgi:hypothetical protein